VLVNEIIAHFNDYQDEYIAFCVTLQGSIDGLDACFAGEEDNPSIRLRVLQVLFNIYHFYAESFMDLDEDIPGLLVGNTTAEERQIITTWVREAKGDVSNLQKYETLIEALAKGSQQ
jgi:hypothetical protein